MALKYSKIIEYAFSYDGIPSPNVPINERYAGIVTNLIEHPVQLKPPNAGLDKVCIKVSSIAASF